MKKTWSAEVLNLICICNQIYHQNCEGILHKIKVLCVAVADIVCLDFISTSGIALGLS